MAGPHCDHMGTTIFYGASSQSAFSTSLSLEAGFEMFDSCQFGPLYVEVSIKPWMNI